MHAVLGFHTDVPPLDGGSIRSWELHKLLVERLPHHFYAREGIYDESDSVVRSYSAPKSSKRLTALKVLLKRSHYVLQRHVSKEGRACLATNRKRYESVYANFVWSASLSEAGVVDYVDTHNSEEAWFRNVAAQSGSRLVKAVCDLSLRHSLLSIKRIPNQATFLHVSSADAIWYQSLRPECNHVVVPNGCRLWGGRPFKVGKSPGSRRKAYFLGSLGVSMNSDALIHFAKHYWSSLRESVEFSVYGSNPPPAVESLCRECGWTLRANLSDSCLDNELDSFEFAVMPFERSAGSKLKFYDALGRGMYVLSTNAAAEGMGMLPNTVMIADSAQDWERVVNAAPRLDRKAAKPSMEYAENFTWAGVYGQFLNNDAGPLGRAWRDR